MAALRIYFTDALHSGAAAKSAATSGAAEQLLAFINSRYAAYQTALLQQLQAAKPSAVQHAAVQALMECTRAGAPSSVKPALQFVRAVLRVLQSLMWLTLHPCADWLTYICSVDAD